jgi:hygromycin-B 7''-O-kinase
MAKMLPIDASRAEYAALRGDPARWRDAIVTVAVRHGHVAGPVHPLGGSNLVAAIDGDLIVKLFPPFLRYQWQSERLALAALDGRLTLAATPRLAHDGDLDGWPYLIMTRLGGVSLEDVWPAAREPDRIDLLAQIGALIAEVQAIDPAPLASIGPGWDDFVRTQRASVVARHARLGAPPALVAELDAYLDRAAPDLPRAITPVILTGEYTPENLRVAPRAGGGWHITGLIDFGDAWTGPADYDLLGPATFLCAGDAARLRALVGAPITPAVRARLMAMLLLHRHSDLGVQVRIDGWRERAPSLDALAALIFPSSTV